MRHHHVVLSTALNEAVKVGLLRANPCHQVTPPKPGTHEMVCLDVDELGTLLEAARERPQYAAIYLSAHTGLRRSELLGIRWRDTDLVNATLSVVQGLHEVPGEGLQAAPPKSRRSKRTIDLTPETVMVLQAWRELQEAELEDSGAKQSRDGYVFCHADGKPWTPSGVSSVFKRVAKAAGFTTMRLHDLRHTHATILLRLGVNPKVVSDRLGHEDVGLYLRTYAHALPSIQREAMDLYEQAIKSVR